MKKQDRKPAKIGDYHVLPIHLPSHPALSFEAVHYIYFKVHTPNVPTIDSSRSLFLVNIPIDSTEVHLKHLLSTQLGLPAGRIQEVSFEGTPAKKTPNPDPSGGSGKKSKKRKRGQDDGEIKPIESTLPKTWDRRLQGSGSTAVVVFVDKASLDAALKAARAVHAKGREIVWADGIEDKIPKLGSQRYLTHEKLVFPPREVLLKAVNDYMTVFSANQEAAAKELARKRAVPDDDGFITVTRGGRNAAARMEDAQESLERQKEKRKGLNDFYRFQGREARKAKAAELVKKFEEDKEKVRKMKAGRKRFKPE